MTENAKQWKLWLKAVREEAGFGPVQIKRDLDGRIHCETGPAVITPTYTQWYVGGKSHGPRTDIFGSVAYHFQGVLIPARFYKNRDKITIEEILKHPNTEVRRVGLNLYGLERLMEEKKFKAIHEEPEKNRMLFSIELGSDASGRDAEPSVFVRVENSTPEPDGTYKIYYLAVPPTMKTCQQAVAWTFRMDEDDYAPVQET